VKHWETLECQVCRRTGGKRTPGSGNGRLKGDIRAVDSEGLLWGIEAKDSLRDVFCLKMEWFEELVRDCGSECELALVVRWGQHVVFYVHNYTPGVSVDRWRTRNVCDLADLPPVVRTADSEWIATVPEDFYTLFP